MTEFDATSKPRVQAQAQELLLVDRSAGVLTLTLNRPAQANALSPSLVEQLMDQLQQLEGIHLCVFAGYGKHFCAGFDLSELENLSDGDLLHRFLRIETLLQKIHHLPVPTVALAQGRLVGAGADLFLSCWYRIATPGSSLRMPGWNFDLALGTRRLEHLVGSDQVIDILIDSRTVSLDEALEWKLVARELSSDQWPEAIDALSRRCATLSPDALANLLSLTRRDTRDADLAALVRTAGKPGLRQRLLAYRQSVQRHRPPPTGRATFRTGVPS